MRRALCWGILAIAVLTPASPPASARAPSCVLDGIDDRCERWAQAHSGPTQGNAYLDEHARDVTFSSDGTLVLITGTKAWPGSGTDAVTVAYDAASGSVRWTAREDEGSATANAVTAIDGVVTITGSQRIGSGGERLMVAAYDEATGARLWRTTYAPPGGGAHIGYAVSVVGDVVVVAGEGGGTTGKEFVTLALTRADGTLRWQARETGAPGGLIGASRLVVDGARGRAFVTGALRGSGNQMDMDFVTAAYDLTGPAPNRLWVAWYDGGARGLDVAFDLALDPAGETLYVTGPSQEGDGPLTDPATATIAYDAHDGSVRWERRHIVADAASTGMRALVSPDGARVHVAGVQSGTGPRSGEFDFRVLTYAATDGAQEWVAAFTGPGYSEEYPFDAVLSPDGGAVYVTGMSSLNGHGADFATVEFAAGTGAVVGTARYNSSPAGVDGSVPRAIAVAADGSALAVTGQFTYFGPASLFVPQENDRDFGTVVYDL